HGRTSLHVAGPNRSGQTELRARGRQAVGVEARASAQEVPRFACAAREVGAAQTRNCVAAKACCAAKDAATECRVDSTAPTPASFRPKTPCGAYRENDVARAAR